MAAKKPPAPVDVLVVCSTHGLVGARKTGGKVMMPGGVRVLSNTAGPASIPLGFVAGAIFVDDSALMGVLQREWLDQMLEVLLP